MFDIKLERVAMKSLNANDAAMFKRILSPDEKESYSHVPPSVMKV